MQVFYDDGSGTTERSIEYLRNFVRKTPDFKPHHACIESSVAARSGPAALDRTFNLEINGDVKGHPYVILLSGCGCGYGGEGPHGTMAVLNYLIDKNFDHRRIARAYYLNEYPEVREAIVASSHVHFDLTGNRILSQVLDAPDDMMTGLVG